MPVLKSLAHLGLQLDPNRSQPIYAQLAAALADAIRAGRIAVGARLPSERAYAEHLGVSRTTVTAAYQELKAAGLVRGHVGRGAVVAADDQEPASIGTVPWSSLAVRTAQAAQPSRAVTERDLISFGNGWLHPSLVPRTALADGAAKALRNADAFSKTAPILGLPALREALIDGLRATGVKATSSDVLITGGAQQGLNVVAHALISPGDTVLCERPTWHGAFRAFRAAGAEVTGIATDSEGVDPDALEEALYRRRAKFVYLIPTLQCPTGRVLGLQRRQRILELCARFRTPILESHVYSPLAFHKPPPSLKSLDELGIVILQGSASKTISPNLRLGWLVAPPAALDLLAPAKDSLDLSTPALAQAILAEFLSNGGIARHLGHLRTQLQLRRDALIEALTTACPQLRYAVPDGGLYLWARLPQTVTAHEIEAAAAVEGVSVRSGAAFLPDGGASNYVRLCYAAPALSEIAVGAQRLGHALRALSERHSNQPEQVSAIADV